MLYLPAAGRLVDDGEDEQIASAQFQAVFMTFSCLALKSSSPTFSSGLNSFKRKPPAVCRAPKEPLIPRLLGKKQMGGSGIRVARLEFARGARLKKKNNLASDPRSGSGIGFRGHHYEVRWGKSY